MPRDNRGKQSVRDILKGVPDVATRRIAWKEARAKLVRQLDALKALEPIHGSAWVEGQSRYWRKRLAEMDANKP